MFAVELKLIKNLYKNMCTNKLFKYKRTCVLYINMYICGLLQCAPIYPSSLNQSVSDYVCFFPLFCYLLASDLYLTTGTTK